MRLTTVLFAAFIIGCTVAPKVIDRSSTLLLPIATAQRDLAAHDLPAVKIDLDHAEIAAKEVANEDMAVQVTLANDESFIKQHHDDLLGARTHRIEKWIAIIGIPLFSIAGAILIYTGNATALATVGHTAIVALSGGLHAVTLAVAWIIRRKKVKTP